MLLSIYALPSLISTLLLFGLGVFTLLRRRSANGALAFALLMFCGSLWSLGFALSITFTAFDTKLFWMNVAQIGPDFSSPLWLIMIKQYTDRPHWLNRKRQLALFILPVITTILMWTNDWHHLLRLTVFPHTLAENIQYVGITRGPWFWVEVIYAYLLFGLALYTILRFGFQKHFNYQVVSLVVSLLIPLGSNFLDVLNLNPLKPYGATSIFLTFSGLILAWGLFRQRLFDLTPIAREKAIESMFDSVVVVDANGRIVDYNPAAKRLFWPDETRKSILGKPALYRLSLWVKDSERIANLKFPDEPILLHDIENKDHQFFNITISPLKQKDQFIGRVSIFHNVTALHETNERLQVQLDENKILQEQLREQAMRDPLTGCFNRRVLHDTLPKELARAERGEYPVSVAMIDIDHFKIVNDTYGHAAGDQTLTLISEVLHTSIRSGDQVFRMGGEEFLLVLPNVDGITAAERLNYIRQTIESIRLPFEGLTVNITISIGISVYPSDGFTLDSLINRADKALYCAKQQGRNRVVLST